MATANFHARIERINQAQRQASVKPRRVQAVSSTHAPQRAYAAARGTVQRRASMSRLLAPVGIGLVLGFFAGLLLTAVTTAGSPIGPGTAYNRELFLVALAGLGLSPLFMLGALIFQGRKPRFALFALAYLSGLILTLVM